MARPGQQPRLTTIFWRDIPAQVTARAGRARASARLSDRFQVAIDAAALRAGKTHTDDYLAEWREERTDCGSDLDEAVEQRSAELEARFTKSVLQAHINTAGWAP